LSRKFRRNPRHALGTPGRKFPPSGHDYPGIRSIKVWGEISLFEKDPEEAEAAKTVLRLKEPSTGRCQDYLCSL